MISARLSGLVLILVVSRDGWVVPGEAHGRNRVVPVRAERRRLASDAWRPDVDVAGERGSIALALLGPVAWAFEGDDAGGKGEGFAEVVGDHDHGQLGFVPKLFH